MVLPPVPVPVQTSDPDQAWKVLTLVNDWVKHAETKIAATLAASGVAAGVLFNLVKDQHERSLWLNLTAATCTVLILLAGVLAGIALRPRLRIKRGQPEAPTSPLYFGHVARRYEGDAAAGYPAALTALTVDPDWLTEEIARQVHANATVAHRKHRLGQAAILMLLLGLPFLAATAMVIAQGW